MKEFNHINLSKNLPDSFAKNKDSNNYKLLEIEKISRDSFRLDLQAIFDSLDINQATGKTLDLYGDIVEQPRGAATDAQYRLMIKSKIAQNTSTGDYPSVLRAICMTFNCEPSEVQITEKEDSCEIEITSLPFAIINGAGLTASQAVAMVNRLLPAGVKVASYLFDGTFEFATSYEDMKVDGETKGLTDTYENMKNTEAIGGYLGITMGDENETVLPI